MVHVGAATVVWAVPRRNSQETTTRSSRQSGCRLSSIKCSTALRRAHASCTPAGVEPAVLCVQVRWSPVHVSHPFFAFDDHACVNLSSGRPKTEVTILLRDGDTGHGKIQRKQNEAHHSQRCRAPRGRGSPSGRRRHPYRMLALRVLLTLLTPHLVDLWERGAYETRCCHQRTRET